MDGQQNMLMNTERYQEVNMEMLIFLRIAGQKLENGAQEAPVFLSL